jgi:outer membrane protein assembly factor BamE (lipoprotein component of BamABCDE complex)
MARSDVPRRRRSLAVRRSLCCLAGALILAGCNVFTSPPTLRGAQVDPDELKQLVPGTSTRKDVQALIGSPTTKGTFDDHWVYISQTTHSRIAMLPGVDKQAVVVLSFDQNGVLRTIDQRGMKDGKSIAMVDRTTPSPGSEASFMQQLLGNIGRFNPGGPAAAGGPQPGDSGASFGTGTH